MTEEVLDDNAGAPWPESLDETTKPNLNPGSDWSTERGCTCDGPLNNDGQIRPDDGWTIDVDCPLHELQVMMPRPVVEEPV